MASHQQYEQSFPQRKRPHNHTSYFESDQPASMLGSVAAAAGPIPRHSVADKVEQAKQKVKAQGSANLGPSSRLAAAVAGPIKAKKRKVRVMHVEYSRLMLSTLYDCGHMYATVPCYLRNRVDGVRCNIPISSLHSLSVSHPVICQSV